MRDAFRLGVLLVIAGCSGAPGAPVAATQLGAHILHGHNDYLQPAPLRTALELGLGSVEADVFLADGELRIGHERWQLRAGRTLRSLYLEPLADRWRRAGIAGPDGRPFVLLVDIKADPAAVWPVLQAELESFRPMLTRFGPGRVEPGAVTVILSGARPLAQVAAASDRLCALDGRLVDLNAAPSPPRDLMPWISDSWSRVSDWTGADEPLPDEVERIRALVAMAHAQGRELRFWGAPDRREAWQLLRELGVDRIGTDRPRAAVAWLRSVSVGEAPR